MDVKIGANDWLALRTRALFFLPELILKFSESGLTQNAIIEESKSLQEKIGPAVIKSVLSCHPVTHKKALGVLSAYNSLMVKSDGQGIDEKMIVGALFRTNPLQSIMSKYEIDAAGLAVKSVLSISCIENMRRAGRVHLHAALSVKSALRSEYKVGTGLGENFISCSKSGTKAIFKTDDDDDPFMIKFSDLRAAPETGHPWAISA